jgi:type I restriction enzyme S subunit
MIMADNNENKVLNVPHLRFPEFSGEWETKSINDLADVIGGGTPDTTVKSYWDGGIQWFTPSEIGKNKFVDASLRTITEDGLNNSSAKLLPPNTILLSSRATIGECSLSLRECATNQGFQSLVSKKCNVDFLYYLIQTKKKDLIRKSCGSTFLEISANEVRKIQVSVPSDVEQQKIAGLLSLIDKRIATQNKIIEDLKKLKSAISHILFSSKGAIHLSEIANVVMGQSPSSNAYNDQGLGIPLVQGNLDISNGKTTPRLYTAEFNQTTEKGNIILTVRAPVGEVAKATQKVCLGRGVCAIIPHEENMSDFIYQYLTFYKFMWRRYEQGSTFTSINGSDVRNIFCPKVRNVSILTLLDIKINIEERVVKQYQSQKQYMLYQMFI